MKQSWLNDELERMWKKWSWLNVRYYLEIYLEGLRISSLQAKI
jgi:hypothetical protein